MTSLAIKPQFLLLQVIDPHYHREDALSNMAELEQLVTTYGGEVVHKVIQHRVKPHPNTYVGPGKVEQLKELVKTAAIQIVAINDLLKPSQLFRLERELWEVNPLIEVWDRLDLILHIFDRHAMSTEAKLQIELARLTHHGPRIYGLGKTELSRQGGGIGTRGKGETNIEFERRQIKVRQQAIRKELARLVKQKERRLELRFEKGLGPVALVGYTSAGKTTLFNLLTGKIKEESPALFTTLDTVVGKMKAPTGSAPIIVSDTIGFIQDLPPVLVEAFQSTLLESRQAKLLLHVVDGADVHWQEKMQVVTDILAQVRLSQPVITVFNKIDVLQPAHLRLLRSQAELFHPVVFVSAKTAAGVDQLKKLIWKHLSP